MSLRSKIALVLFAVVVLYSAADHAMYRIRFASDFVDLEEASAIENLQRVLGEIRVQVQDVSERGRILAESLADDGMRDLSPDESLHLLIVCRPNGDILKQVITDPATRKEMVLRDFPNESLSTRNPLLEQLHERDIASGLSVRDVTSGLLITEHGPMSVCARTVDVGTGDEPDLRHLITGRFLDRVLMGMIRARTQIDFVWWLLDRDPLPPREQALMDLLTASDQPIVEPSDDEHLNAWVVQRDVRDHPVLLIRANCQRTLYPLWKRNVGYMILSALSLALLFPLVILFLLGKIVTGPLSQLTSHAVTVGSSDDSAARLEMERSDEIGQLSREFDRMLDKLSQSRTEVVRNARLAGMSDISAGVIHNVGNVLNSVNISAGITARSIDRIEVGNLKVIAMELARNRGHLDEYLESDPKGSYLLKFFGALVMDIEARTQSSKEEVHGLRAGIEHIMTLVSSLQSFDARVTNVERVLITEQVEAALALCLQASDPSVDIEFIREYEEVPCILLDTHKLFEILVNLIQNAVQSLEQAKRSDRILILRIYPKDDVLCVDVDDNGVGIAEEDQTRIFNMGHTTKAESTGLGLHVSAISASDMGATLRAKSDGPGMGATFSLQIPLRLASTPDLGPVAIGLGDLPPPLPVELEDEEAEEGWHSLIASTQDPEEPEDEGPARDGPGSAQRQAV